MTGDKDKRLSRLELELFYSRKEEARLEGRLAFAEAVVSATLELLKERDPAVPLVDRDVEARR